MTVSGELAGAQRVLLDICLKLDPEEYDRHVICQTEGPLTDELRKNGVTEHLVSSLVRPIRPHKDLVAFFKLFRICRRERFDVVHTHSSKSGLLGRIASRLAGVPHIVHHVHGFSFHEFSSWPEKFIHSQIERIAAWFCDKVIFVNDEEREMSIANHWISERKCLTIYNGTDLDEFDAKHHQEFRTQFRKDNSIDNDELLILVCGRIGPQKQSLIVPGIAKELELLCPERKWKIIVAGTGPQEGELIANIDELKVRHRVEYIGWHPNPQKLTATVDLMLLPSLWEGLPLVLIEAQAASLPIVASNIKGNREVVTKETGILCDSKDAVAYAKALDSLCRDPELRTRFAAAARQRAVTEFDGSRTIENVLDLYNKLLN